MKTAINQINWFLQQAKRVKPKTREAALHYSAIIIKANTRGKLTRAFKQPKGGPSHDVDSLPEAILA